MPKNYNTRYSNHRQNHLSEISGIFQIPYESESQDEKSDESDGNEENDPWLDFEGIEAADRSVRSRIPKREKRFLGKQKLNKDIEVQIKDDNGKIHTCNGKFPFTQVFWKVTIKVSKGWLRHAPIYAIRTDDNVQKDKLVMIFLTDCLNGHYKTDIAIAVTACFEGFCHFTGIESTLNFTNLERTLENYMKWEHLQGCCLSNLKGVNGQLRQEDHSVYIQQIMKKSDLCTVVMCAASHSNLLKAVSKLLPYSFMQFLHKLELKENAHADTEEEMFPAGESALQLADDMADHRPWEFAFKDIIFARLKLQGTEATLSAYENAGYLSQTPQAVKDAIYIYEVLKVDARQDGNTYMSFPRLQNYYYFKTLRYSIIGEERWKNAFDFLERNNVIKRETFNGNMNIFLRCNWQAEVDIVKGLQAILERHQKEPLRWVVDYESPDFERMCRDPDQLKALHLIASSPIAVLSGKGGCGKTTVITTLLKHMYDQMERSMIETRQEKLEYHENTEETDKKVTYEHEDDTYENTYIRDHEDEDLIAYRSRTENTDIKLPLKPLDISYIASSSHNLMNTASHCLGKAAIVPTQDVADSETNWTTYCSNLDLELTPNVTRCNETAQDLIPCLDSTDSSYNSQTTIKGKRRWTQPSKSVTSKEDILQRDVIADLIKIVKLAKDVEHPLLQEYKKRMLLTAPTGKAARLLGCKAGLNSATLHSVIMSWRMYTKQTNSSEAEETNTWGYSEVEVLVVDECSLLSVRLFACMMNILLKNANLKKIVLLGDVRQLPSIEAGNFLTDIFKAFGSMSNEQFRLSLELTSNHRSESNLIIENAGRISNQMMPNFDSKQKFHLQEISNQADDNERDEAIRYLLEHAEDLHSQVDSQFISFRNADCRAVNELCCRHYNQHSILTASFGGREGRSDFRIGDKVCLGKNAVVKNCHQLMLSKYIDLDTELQDTVNQAMLKDNKPNLEQTRGGANFQENLNRITMDAAEVMNLFESDDALIDRTLNEMKEKDRHVDKVKADREKQLMQTVGQEPEIKLSEKKTSSFLGQEKLCNGEIFFIMDDIEECNKDQTNARSERYLVLSDRDPYSPRVVCVSFKVLRKVCKMKHSWARTIHTFQGSESDSVIYVLGKAIPQNWQHVYTAVTRGKKSVCIIGSQAELYKAVSKKEYPRHSRLRHRLEEMIEMCKTSFLESLNADIRNTTAASNIDDMDSNDSWMYTVNLKNTTAASNIDDIDSDDSWMYTVNLKNTTAASNIDDIDSNDSWVNAVNLEHNLEDSIQSEGVTEVKQLNIEKTEDDDSQMTVADDDRINNLNQKSDQHKNMQDDFNVFHSFEDNENIYVSDEEFLDFQISTTDFTSSVGPNALISPSVNLNTENNSSGTFCKERLNTSPVRIAVGKKASILHTERTAEIPGSSTDSLLLNNSEKLFTPPKSSSSKQTYSHSCGEKLSPNNKSLGSPSKVKCTESPFSTAFRDNFSHSLTLEEELDNSTSPRRKVRKNLTEL